MMDVTAAEEEIKRWKMAAEAEAEAGGSIEKEFQIQVNTNIFYIYSSYSLGVQCHFCVFLGDWGYS